MSGHRELGAAFERFARVEAPDLDSPTYATLAAGVAGDGELLALAAHRQQGQPAPNMLFGAVQYLLLQGVEHPLAAHYPILAGGDRPAGPSQPDAPAAGASARSPASGAGAGKEGSRAAFPLFREFCLEHRERIAELVASRSTQTQVVRRCTCLLPAFGIVHREALAPLALVDIGASAGLNLLFDRYAYRYWRVGREAREPRGRRGDPLTLLRWGPPEAAIRLEAELRGDEAPPAPPGEIPVAGREGIDLNPIDLDDPDQLLWLRALIWPEHVERHAEIIAAAAELKESPVRLHRGDATAMLGGVLDRVPAGAALVVYSTIALYQVPLEGRRRIARTLADCSRARPVWQVALEGVHPPSLTLTRYLDGSRRETDLLARASPHGWWIEWRDA